MAVKKTSKGFGEMKPNKLSDKQFIYSYWGEGLGWLRPVARYKWGKPIWNLAFIIVKTVYFKWLEQKGATNAK